jgi:drug/metabolite transporter (DMT)-like permease
MNTNSMHILASDTLGPLVLILFLAPIVLGFLCVILFLIKRPRPTVDGRRSRWGLVLGLVPTIFGVFLILMLLTTRGGAPQFFYIAAALPLLIGMRILLFWRRYNRR